MIHGDRIQVEVGEGLAEVPCGDAGHAHGRQSLDFVKAQLQKLGVSDGIDVRVVGAGAVPGHQEGFAFVQIVHDRGMPLVKHAVHGLGGLVGLLVSVTIDIDEGVLRPVGRRLPGQGGAVGFAFEITIEPLHHLVAAIGVGDGVDENHELLADALDHGLFGNRQAIRHFQHGFGGAGFVGMQGGVEIIDGPGIRDQAFGGSMSVRRGSARAAVAAFKRSRSRMPDSSAIASSRISRPSSLWPMVKTRTRGEAAARARQ